MGLSGHAGQLISRNTFSWEKMVVSSSMEPSRKWKTIRSLILSPRNQSQISRSEDRPSLVTEGKKPLHGSESLPDA